MDLATAVKSFILQARGFGMKQFSKSFFFLVLFIFFKILLIHLFVSSGKIDDRHSDDILHGSFGKI